MKIRYTLAITVGLAVATLSGCDSVGTNNPSTLPDVDAAPQIEISRDVLMDVKKLPIDTPVMYTANGDTTGNE
ncbi:MAG: hypothetical protein O7C39_03625 [Bacteroidetes bacterium]|nr:hypothetical protein [Bacteroidota bacterium]